MAEKVLNTFQSVVIVLAGWMNQRQHDVIEYLREKIESCASNSESFACGSRMTSAAV